MSFPILFRSAVLLFLVFSWSTSVFADVYVYKDNNGVLIFSNPQNDPNMEAFLRGMHDLGYVDRRGVGSIMSRIQNDVGVINEFFTRVTREASDPRPPACGRAPARKSPTGL